METTKVFSDLLAAYVDPTIRIIALKGGTRSSKTWSVLQLLNTIAAKTKRPRLISVVSETLPHLKRGAIRDFKKMLNDDEIYNPDLWHDTDKTYSYKRGQIEFFSAGDAGKVHGPSRDILYVNECINIAYEIYRQLAVRTVEKTILDYNPAYEFWVDTKLAHRADVRIISSTYKDNDLLKPSQIAEIESNMLIDPEWWKVYGLGLTGSVEGLCVKPGTWRQIPEMPRGLKKEFLGIDFGWSKPTAIYHVGQGEQDGVYIDEIKYTPGMDNPAIAQAIKDAGLAHLEVICDAAEPKSIAELKKLGIKATKSDNKDIKLGLQIMNRYQKFYTERSLGIIEESRRYKYKKNPITDEYTDEPIDEHNHAIDAVRYVFLNRLSNIAPSFAVTTGRAKK